MNCTEHELIRALAEVVGQARVIADGPDLEHFGSDRCRGGWPVRPMGIVFPGSVAEIQEVVRICARHRVAIVPSGGRTGLAGGATATAGEVVLSLARMHRILEVNEAARTLRCEAGATLESVQEAARARGLLYPVDFSSRGSAQIGGSVATNAGGVRVIRHGLTRDHVAGMTVVIATGDRLELGRGLVKDNTGYDLRQLFIGSEGTLGVIAEVVVKLVTPPAGAVVALCGLASDDAVLELFTRLRRSPLVLGAFECFDHGCVERVLEHRGSDAAGPLAEPSPRYALVEVEVAAPGEAAVEAALASLTTCLEEAAIAGEIEDASFASTPAQARALWSLREDISEALHRHRPHKADVALPIPRVAAFLGDLRRAAAADLAGLEVLCFGHVGDGNIHVNTLCPPTMDHSQFLDVSRRFDRRLYQLVEDHGGSISAEHGIGLLKREHLPHSRSAAELSVMRAIKRALDPEDLFNPGKLFPA
ncbi:MAG: FAD-binding oxidoreductase [Nannocystaceae bacterium]|nr:FAD-binding oxidoreductase [Myxococcales bacterium]